MTKLAPTLPRGEANGLDALTADLTDRPADAHLVIALIDCKKISTDVDTGDVEPTARILRIEAVLPADQGRARVMMATAFENRTGKKTLPGVEPR